jgi:regulatory protein
MPEKDHPDRLEWLTDWVTEQRAAEADRPEPDFDPWSGKDEGSPELTRFEPPAGEPSVLEPAAPGPSLFDSASFGSALPGSALPGSSVSGLPSPEGESSPPGSGSQPPARLPARFPEPPVAEAIERPAAGSGEPDAPSRVSHLRELIAKVETEPTQPPPASRRRRPARVEEPAMDSNDEQPERKPGRRKTASIQRDSGRDPAARAKDICLQLLTARPRTRDELRKALLRKEIEAEVAEQVLGRLDDVGLIDDKAFAEMWVHSRHTYQGMGRRALAVELRRRGVDNDTAAEAVASVDSDAEEERARQLVRKRLPSMGSADQPTKIRRLVGMLARKGYAQGLAYRVVKDELKNVGEETNLLDTFE